ncbi:hypothetical protein V6N13_089732 [Hibiscus sabdariffa]
MCVVVTKLAAGTSLFTGHKVLDAFSTSILGGFCAIFCAFGCGSADRQMTIAASASSMYVVAYGGILCLYTIWNLEDRKDGVGAICNDIVLHHQPNEMVGAAMNELVHEIILLKGDSTTIQE